MIMDEPNSEDTINIEVSVLASLMLYVVDKVRYDGTDPNFSKVKEALLKAEKKAGRHPVYHLECVTNNPEIKGGNWYLWNRVDWDLAEEKWKKEKADAEKRVEQFNDRSDLFADICRCVAKAVCSEPGDDTVKSLATIITNTKNRIMGRQFGVSEEYMNKVWGEEIKK